MSELAALLTPWVEGLADYTTILNDYIVQHIRLTMPKMATRCNSQFSPTLLSYTYIRRAITNTQGMCCPGDI